MKLTGKFFLKNIGEDQVLVPFNNGQVDASSLIDLNDTAVLIYKSIEENKEVDEIVSLFLKEYEVDEETARQDILETLETFKKLGIIE